MTPLKMPDRTPKLLTLRNVLIVPFVGQVLLVTSLVSYWSLQTGRRAISNLVLDLSQQTSTEISLHLDHYLANARKLAEINAEILGQNVVDPDDLDAVGRFFWQQAQRYNIGYLLWGQVNGNYVDVGQPETHDLDLITEQINPQRFGDRGLYTFSIDQQGNPLDLISDPIDYPFQAEAWYDQSLRTGQANWTPVYSWQSPSANPLAIAFSSPVFDQRDNLIGAIAAEQRLWQVEEFLNSLSQRYTLATFIMEPNGTLLASSKLDTAIVPLSTQVESDIPQPLVYHTTNYVQTHLGGWRAIKTVQDFRLVMRGQVLRVHIEPWHGEAELDWLVIVAVPESKYLAEINQNIRRTVILSGGTLLVSLVLGIGIVQFLLHTIQCLNTSVVAIANGNLNHTVARSRIHELDVFSQSFNQMATRLQQSFVQLTQAKDDLERTVTLRTAELAALNQELQYLSVTDELTQLPNRRAFNQRLEVLDQLRQQQCMAFSLIIADIDYFKLYNDFYGHLQGDRCLQQVADILRKLGHRSTDLVARYGGEEFAIILPETDRGGAMAVAQRCQQLLQEAQIPHVRSPINAWVTMSFGIAYLSSKAIASPDQLIQMADVALYQAKKEGRNTIQCYYDAPDNLQESEDRVTG